MHSRRALSGRPLGQKRCLQGALAAWKMKMSLNPFHLGRLLTHWRRLFGPSGRLVEVHRPPSWWDVAGRHLPLALIGAVPLALAHFVPISRLPGVPCLFLKWTGVPCPFCGYTRSFWAMAQGDWAFAFRNAPLACLFYGAAILLLLWNGGALLSGCRFSRGRLLQIPGRLTGPLILIGALLLLSQWLYRIAGSLA
ncbi:hypothetical protein TRIP_B250251 [uncultured Desulfatiglans sp.]|uniref:DUF2752 domain-containing protein n=1 Tax=Uncultured Desulfatiglans sp. TaxID=1748965 RepID=A0A653A519_UNCDX|nr:hypothetical protein TRIP_B250251 [uncultured Desulfatiglans sp.]